MPVSQCGQLAPPAIVSAVSASSLATAQSSAALRLSCSWSIAVSHARCRSPVYAAALCAHSSAKCLAIASRMRTASPRSVSRSRPYWASVWSWVNRTPVAHRDGDHQRLVDEGVEVVGDVVGREVVVGADRLGGREVAAAGEHRQPFEDALLVVEEQLVAPVDDGPQRLLAGQRGARPAGEQAEPVVEPGGDLRDRERPGAGGGQLDGERQPVEPGADVGDDAVGVVGEVRAARRPPGRGPGRGARRRRRASGGTGQMVSPPTRSPSRLVARSRRPGQRRSRSSATSAAVVITCSQLSSTSSSSRSPITSASRFGSGRSRADGDRGGNAGGVADGSQLDQAAAERRARRPRRARPRGRAGSCPPRPGPTSVTKRCSANSAVRSRSSASRPTSGVSASGMRRAGSGAPVAAPGPAAAGGASEGSWAEDRRLQPAQLRARFEAELLAQELAALLEDPERVGLPPGAVQREHQQPAEPLAQRMGGDELLELDDGPLVATELELEVEPLLDHARAETRTTG